MRPCESLFDWALLLFKLHFRDYLSHSTVSKTLSRKDPLKTNSQVGPTTGMTKHCWGSRRGWHGIMRIPEDPRKVLFGISRALSFESLLYIQWEKIPIGFLWNPLWVPMIPQGFPVFCSTIDCRTPWKPWGMTGSPDPRTLHPIIRNQRRLDCHVNDFGASL